MAGRHLHTYEAGLGVTSPVGLFPRARQADRAIDDLAGNVWEWCASFDDAMSKGSVDARVMRGGSWNSSQDYARPASRFRTHPIDRINFIGFRVVCVAHR